MSVNYEQLRRFLGEGEFLFQQKGNSSFCFKREKDEVITDSTAKDEKYRRTLTCIKRHFELDDTFDEFFRQATSGSGNEAKKIDSIWSSSLLSLLFFFSAMKNDGITLNGIHYSKCVFEFQNPVLQNRPNYKKPSNIDCVLISDGEKSLLFIESKFIEYVRDYRDNKLYDKDVLSKSYSKSGESTKDLYYWYAKKQIPFKPHYYYGAKQMITHYSGLWNFVNGCYHSNMKKDNSKKEVITAFENGAKVSLIEIIYDLERIDKKYEEYRNDYMDLQAELHNRMKNDRFEVLDATTYQRLIATANIKLSDKIKMYYSF